MSGNPELIRLIDTIARDKGLEKEILFEGLEVAMVAAARKKYDEAVVLDVVIDRETGTVSGNHDGVAINTDELGRIAAQTAKQVIIQKIREAEQDRIYEEFIVRKGSLVTGAIQRFEGDNIIIDLNNTEAILPRHERVRTETYHVGDRIRAVIADVKKVGHRVRIVLSRTHPDLIRRLFEIEIPEIADHVIEIKALAREPGFRTKLAVVSYDSKVDCVGACVGMRGSRIRNVIDELNGEKIDIIRWNDSPEVLIMNALKPAEIMSITLDDETMEAVVTVADDQLSLAIGKRGQNVRLAARLTGWDVNIQGMNAEAGRPEGEGEAAEDAQLSDEEQRVLESLRAESAGGEEGEGGGDPLLDMARADAAPTTAQALFGDDEAPARPASAEPTTAAELFGSSAGSGDGAETAEEPAAETVQEPAPEEPAPEEPAPEEPAADAATETEEEAPAIPEKRNSEAVAESTDDEAAPKTPEDAAS